MATVTHVTLGIGSKTSANYQSSETSLSATYALDEQERYNWIGFVRNHVGEVETAHREIRKRLQELRGDIPVETGLGIHRTVQTEDRSAS